MIFRALQIKYKGSEFEDLYKEEVTTLLVNII